MKLRAGAGEGAGVPRDRPGSAGSVLSANMEEFYESHTHGLSQPVFYTQPLQLRAPVESTYAKVIRRRRSWFSWHIQNENAMQEKMPAGYWTVRTLGLTRRKRDIACLGEMDTTSVFAFRDADGQRCEDPPTKEDECECVQYNTQLTLYTNFGVGGRFLTTVPGNFFKYPTLGWQMTADELHDSKSYQNTARSSQWIVRKISFSARTEQCSPSTTGTCPPGVAKDDIVRCGDLIALESVENPGFFAAVRRGVICIRQGCDERSHMQLVAPSLKFALQLREKTPMYRKSAVGFSAPSLIPKAPVVSQSIRDILPKEIITYCFSFHQGCTPPAKDISAFQLQVLHDQRSLSQRRDGMPPLRAIRAVCREWRYLANHLVSSIRVGFMLELSSRSQRRMLLNMVTGCKNLTSLSLRNLDTMTDCDVMKLARNSALRCLNLGGCYKITDRSCSVLGNLPLIHLNLAMCDITDTGLCRLAHSLPDLCTLNLYGVQQITEVGVRELLTNCLRLTSINLRGTNLTHESAHRLRGSISNGCDILTGAMLVSSVYGVPASSIVQHGQDGDDEMSSSDGISAPSAGISAPSAVSIQQQPNTLLSQARFSAVREENDMKEDKGDSRKTVHQIIQAPMSLTGNRTIGFGAHDLSPANPSLEESSSHFRDSVTSLDDLVREGMDIDELFDEEQSHMSALSRRLSSVGLPPSIVINKRVNVFEQDTNTLAPLSDHDYRRTHSAYAVLEEKKEDSSRSPQLVCTGSAYESFSPSRIAQEKQNRRRSDFHNLPRS